MMTLQELKTLITAKLNSVVSLPVYNKQAIGYPCIVYNLSGLDNMVRNREEFILEVNFWNDSLDDSELLTAYEQVKTVFNYAWETGTTGFLQSHLIWSGEIPDIEPNVCRLQQRYQLKVR